MNDKTTKNYSKEIAFPLDVAKRYEKYCAVTKMNMTETLRVLVLECLPQIHNAQNLDEIIVKTRERSRDDEYKKFYVRLPNDAVDELNTFCRFFKLNWRRCHFLYFMIEGKLLKMIEDVLNE